jgi:hypothetical protein
LGVHRIALDDLSAPPLSRKAYKVIFWQFVFKKGNLLEGLVKTDGSFLLLHEVDPKRVETQVVKLLEDSRFCIGSLGGGYLLEKALVLFRDLGAHSIVFFA